MAAVAAQSDIHARRVPLCYKWSRICCVSANSNTTGAGMETQRSARNGDSQDTSSRRDDFPFNLQLGGRHDSFVSRKSHSSRGSDIHSNADSLLAFLKSTVFARPRLQVDPSGKLFFMYEPGKQATSVVKLKNTSTSFVAFKFQTNAPKSCFMRPPNGILAPKETLLASVVKFVEPPEQQQNQRGRHSEPASTNDKFKILSLKVDEGGEYTPELFEERRETLRVESVLRVVFLDPKRPSKELEKLKERIAEAEAIRQERKTPEPDEPNKQTSPAAAAAAAGVGVLTEWREQRERYLAKQ